MRHGEASTLVADGCDTRCRAGAATEQVPPRAHSDFAVYAYYA